MTQSFPAVVDYSYGRPDPQWIKDSGYEGALRYLGHDGRCVTQSEANRLLDVGLGVGLIYEESAAAALGGWGTGQAHADKANRYADEIGAPGVPIFYAVDFQPTLDELYGPIAEYFQGAMSAGGRPVRAYGCASVMQALCGDLGFFPDSWQCAAWSYPGSAPGTPIYDGGWNLILSPYASMLQCIGYVLADTSDHNNLITADRSFMWGYEQEKPDEEEEDKDMLAIYHSGPGSEAVRAWGIPNNVRQAFWVVNSQTASYLGASDMNEERLVSARNWLAINGTPTAEYGNDDQGVPEGWLQMLVYTKGDTHA
jgi:hypothetical protein